MRNPHRGFLVQAESPVEFATAPRERNQGAQKKTANALLDIRGQ